MRKSKCARVCVCVSQRHAGSKMLPSSALHEDDSIFDLDEFRSASKHVLWGGPSSGSPPAPVDSLGSEWESSDSYWCPRSPPWLYRADADSIAASLHQPRNAPMIQNITETIAQQQPPNETQRPTDAEISQPDGHTNPPIVCSNGDFIALARS